MAFHLPNVLSLGILEQVSQMLPLQSWRDGKETAGHLAKAQKQNEQADLSTREGAKLRTILSNAIVANTAVQSIAWPKVISKVLVSRTPVGGGYDWHTDDALMQSGAGKHRTDLSFTLFLSAPDSYDGGALEIHAGGEVETHKYAPGDMVLYTSDRLHRVAPVTAGTRVVCVGWIESVLRDPRQRDILFDLVTLRETLLKQYEPGTPEILSLSKTISNLLRQWAEI